MRRHFTIFGLILAVAATAGRIAAGAATDGGIPMTVAVTNAPAEPGRPVRLDLPGTAPSAIVFPLQAPTPSWIDLAGLEFDVFWPEGGPTNGQAMLQMKDWDYFWYQHLLPGYLKPGQWSHFRVDLSPGAPGWEARGHHGAWHLLVLMEPKDVALQVFSKEPASGGCILANVIGLPRRVSKPFIANVRPSADRIPCFETFVLTFELPDQYPDPFDPEKVSVTADFEPPGGGAVRVEGFYGRDYYRDQTTGGERLLPQGPPWWQVRFTPVRPGPHRYTLAVRDAEGRAQWGPAVFEATQARRPGFVRVSARDPRYFEFDDGSYYFPIGQNIRSPFDSRLNDLFPWVQRRMESTSVYARYFDAMRRNGGNFVEVWSAAWSLGLEWTRNWPGYHGIGHYNMANAWEMDRVVEEAERCGVYLNLVINNHGKFSAFVDSEWPNNPFNVANGGFLQNPEDYFTDPRALKAFRNLMRYMVARWAPSPHLFAWQLWSELDLTGTKWDQRMHTRPEVADWHRLMGRSIKEMDPYDHLISTHVCGDYTHQHQPLISLPEIDHCAVDAYHDNPDPTHIVALMKATAEFNNAIGKPVLITEFGGSHMAQSLKHLDESLHAGLWASTSIPVAGTPLFWWWQLVEEEHFYPKYGALSRYIAGEDRRDPRMAMSAPALTVDGAAAPRLAAQCLRGPTRALGWIYHTEDFRRIDPEGEAVTTNVVMTLDGLSNTEFTVEFWDTGVGRCVDTATVQAAGGAANVPVVPFARDVAFKVKMREPGQPPADAQGARNEAPQR